MKKRKNIPTGPAIALKVAYDTLTKILKYTHKRLNEETGISYYALRNIRDEKLGQRNPIRKYYLPKFIKLLMEEYQNHIWNGGNGSMDILRALGQILCHENELGELLPPKDDVY